MTTTLEAAGISKSWSGRRIFAGVTISVENGLVAVAGVNGSGKTTLLKILAGLLRPDSGALTIRDGGEELSGDRKRQAIGWAGPDLTFYDDLTAEENLSFFRRAGGRPAPQDQIRARLERVGLSSAADRFVGAYSTGMKQRLRLAFATLFDPPILLVDEPMAGLDDAGRELASAIVRAHRRDGAVVLASNDARDFDCPDQRIDLSSPPPADAGASASSSGIRP